MFRHYRVILWGHVINTLLIYASISNILPTAAFEILV